MADSAVASYLLGAVVLGVIAYSGLMTAMRTGEVSVVTPFRYSRLLFGIASGVLLFEGRLDLPMLVGCALIGVSGWVILWRGTAVTPKSSPKKTAG